MRKRSARSTRDEPRAGAGAADAVAQVGIAVRRMGTQSVITSRTVAARFGLHTTDLEVLDLIHLRQSVSPGELAIATGLTSGSVTALVDRLAKAGYVERRVDPDDRRRVLVRVRQDAVAPIKTLYDAMQRRMVALWSTFDARDLEVITDFLARSTALAVECCKDIQAGGDDRRPAAPRKTRQRGTPRKRAAPA